MPMHRRRPDRPDRPRRVVQLGGEYTRDEEARDEIELEQVTPADEPPVEVQGEPWGWTKPGPRPRGWREDGRYGTD